MPDAKARPKARREPKAPRPAQPTEPEPKGREAKGPPIGSTEWLTDATR